MSLILNLDHSHFYLNVKLDYLFLYDWFCTNFLNKSAIHSKIVNQNPKFQLIIDH